MATLTAAIQWVNLAGLAGIVLTAAVLWRRYPDTRGLLLPPILWAAYGVVFYVLVLTGHASPAATLLWGAIHRMLAVVMILGGLIALWAILIYPPPGEDDE
jgi:hypothetical protein